MRKREDFPTRGGRVGKNGKCIGKEKNGKKKFRGKKTSVKERVTWAGLGTGEKNCGHGKMGH